MGLRWEFMMVVDVEYLNRSFFWRWNVFCEFYCSAVNFLLSVFDDNLIDWQFCGEFQISYNNREWFRYLQYCNWCSVLTKVSKVKTMIRLKIEFAFENVSYQSFNIRPKIYLKQVPFYRYPPGLHFYWFQRNLLKSNDEHTKFTSLIKLHFPSSSIYMLIYL